MAPQEAFANPLYDPLRGWLEKLPPRPDTAALNALLANNPRLTATGLPLRFTPPQDDGLGYEQRIDLRGEVETRPNNWHDHFNALAWLSFPLTKRAVSAGHAAAMNPDLAVRGTARDALTHFDECGIVALSTAPELLELLAGFQWRELFVASRDAVMTQMRFVLFGHATYEALLAPFRGVTAKAVMYEVEPDWLTLSGEELNAAVDLRLSADLLSGRYRRPRDFQPLPILGIPGVTPENEEPSYYDDTWQFRPGRRGLIPPGVATL